MLRILPWLLLPLNLVAQVSVTFTNQAEVGLVASTGAKIKGVALLGVSVCSDYRNEIELDSVRVYVAAAEIQTMMPEVGMRIVQRSFQRNIWSRILRWTGYLAQAFSLVAITKQVKISESQQQAIALLGAALPFLASFSKDRVPDTQELQASIMRGRLKIPAVGCYTGTALAVYDKSFRQKVFQVAIP